MPAYDSGALAPFRAETALIENDMLSKSVMDELVQFTRAKLVQLQLGVWAQETI